MNVEQGMFPSEDQINRRLAFSLYERAAGTLYSHGVFGAVFVLLFWGKLPSSILGLWAILLYSNLSVRFWHIRKWLAADDEQRAQPWMSKMSAVTSLVNGIIWASTVLFLDFDAMPFESLAASLMVYGLAAGAAVYAAFFLPAFYLAVVPYLGSHIIFHVFSFSFQSALIALILSVFAVMLYEQTKQLNKVYRNNELNKLLNQKLIDDLREANHRLEDLARLDELTACYNRRFFDETVAYQWSRHVQTKESLALIAIDIDLFKEVNDSFGHTCGDQVLIEVSQRIRTQVRQSDFVCRMGGDEFTVILPHTDLQEAREIAQRIRGDLAVRPMLVDGSEVYISASLGVATSKELADCDQLIRHADGALYRSKAAGRNTVS